MDDDLSLNTINKTLFEDKTILPTDFDEGLLNVNGLIIPEICGRKIEKLKQATFLEKAEQPVWVETILKELHTLKVEVYKIKSS